MEPIVISLLMCRNPLAKDSEIKATTLCLGNISKDFSVDNMKNTRLHGYVYDFSVGYDATAVDGILDIHEYLMKKNDMWVEQNEIKQKTMYKMII